MGMSVEIPQRTIVSVVPPGRKSPKSKEVCQKAATTSTSSSMLEAIRETCWLRRSTVEEALPDAVGTDYNNGT